MRGRVGREGGTGWAGREGGTGRGGREREGREGAPASHPCYCRHTATTAPATPPPPHNTQIHPSIHPCIHPPMHPSMHACRTRPSTSSQANNPHTHQRPYPRAGSPAATQWPLTNQPPP
jgi:hypothetical protein